MAEKYVTENSDDSNERTADAASSAHACDDTSSKIRNINVVKATSIADVIGNIPEGIVNLKLDDVTHVVHKFDITCDYAKCKRKTNLVYQECTYCSHRYCLTHCLPEIHGCTDAVKKDEREKFIHPVPKLSTTREKDRLNRAHTKLDQKLKAMSQSRKQKPSGTGKKGK